MSEPIRILHVLSAMDRAGTENLLMSLYRKIDRNKIQFDFAVSANRKCAFDDEIRSMGGRIFHYPRYRGYNHIQYLLWWKRFFTEHKEHSIVHGHIGSTAAIYLSIAKKYKKYTIAHSHNTNSKLSLTSIIYRFYSYPTRFIADHYFACSKQALIDRYGFKIANNKKISAVLNNAIDTSIFAYDENTRDQIRYEFGISRDELIIGTVGRFTLQKNPEMIIELVKRLSNRKIKFRFLWVGTGELYKAIKEKVRIQNIDKYFIFAGVRNDINKVLMGMDIFVFPSIWEGLGISCVEAQASGLPTLCSETVPIDAKVSDKIYFLPLSDVNRWCDIICDLIESNKIEDRRLYHKTVADNGYDIINVANKLQNFYLSKAK